MIGVKISAQRKSLGRPVFGVTRSEKFAKIGLSTNKGGGFNPDFCFAPLIFSITHAFWAKSRQDMSAPKESGFLIWSKV